jgi:hypothetical protein
MPEWALCVGAFALGGVLSYNWARHCWEKEVHSYEAEIKRWRDKCVCAQQEEKRRKVSQTFSD